MSKVIRSILDSLGTPDSQGRDWYAWATNQLSHIFIGIFYTGTCLLLGLLWFCAVGVCAVLVLVKEGHDLVIDPTWKTAFDKLQDVTFQMLGAAVAVGLFAANALVFGAALLVGAVILATGVLIRAAIQLKKDQT